MSQKQVLRGRRLFPTFYGDLLLQKGKISDKLVTACFTLNPVRFRHAWEAKLRSFLVCGL